MSKYTDYDPAAEVDLTDADLFLVVDVDDLSMAATGTNKKATLADVRAALGAGEISADAVTTTGSLAADATENLDVNLEGLTAAMLVRLQTDIEARVVLYATEAQRTSDAGREIGTDPTGDHGVLLDFVTTAGDLDWSISPPVWLRNADGGVPDGFIAGAVTNLSVSTDTVTVTLTVVTPTGVTGPEGPEGEVSTATFDAHLNDTVDAHDASAISFTPTGGLSATEVAAALAELDSEKAASTHNHAASEITSGTVATARLGSGSATSATFLRGDQSWATPVAVASDTIWDTKGDLAVATAADTAQALTVGTNGFPLQADSAATTGLGYATRTFDFNAKLLSNIDPGSTTVPGLYFTTDSDTGFARSAADTVNVIVGGVGSTFTLTNSKTMLTVGKLTLGGAAQTFSGNTNWVTLTNTSTDVWDTSSVTTATWTGVQFTTNVRATNGATMASVTGLNFSPSTNNTGATSATVTTYTGTLVGPVFAGSGATMNVTSVYGYRFAPSNSSILGNATITTMTGLEITAGSNSTGTGITTKIGISIPTAWAESGPTTWALQVADIQSHHVGKLSLGSTTAPTYALDLKGTAQDRGVLALTETASTPTNPSSSNQLLLYCKNDSVVFAFNDAGTMRYLSITMTGSGTTWTHGTSAP